MFADDETRLTAMTRVLAASVLCCLAFSWKLWLARPYYPLAPVCDWIPGFRRPFDQLSLLVFVGLLAGVAIRPRSRVLVLLVLAMFALLFMQDQNRLWPSFFQFSVLFLVLASRPRAGGAKDARRIVAGMQFVLAATYFWGGVQKLNTHFFYEEFPWFIEPVTSRLPFEVPYLATLGLLAALSETALGVGLLTKRFRTVALYDALAMHGIIFFCIGPLRDDWNNSSWIWGQTVAAQAWILFFRAPAFEWQALFDAPRFYNVPQGLAVLLVGVMPVLNNFNLWDSALSANVYTGNVNYAEIRLRLDAVDRLPKELQPLVRVHFDGAVLELNRWALSEFNANAYPENRLFKIVFRKICSYLPPDSAELVVTEKSGWFFPKKTYRLLPEPKSNITLHGMSSP